MLVPDITKKNNKNNYKDEIEIKTINQKATFYNFDWQNNEKERVKFVKYIEKIIRRSNEYKKYIGFLKRELDLTKCSIFDSIDINELKGVSLEFHHYPFTLFDLVDICLQDKLDKNKMLISPFQIANEVMELHYSNKVGLVPLVVTVHELVHDGQIFLKSDFINGNYKKFIEKYNSSISEELKEKVNMIESQTKKIDDGLVEYDLSVLQKAFTTIKINDVNCINDVNKLFLNEENKEENIEE